MSSARIRACVTKVMSGTAKCAQVRMCCQHVDDVYTWEGILCVDKGLRRSDMTMGDIS